MPDHSHTPQFAAIKPNNAILFPLKYVVQMRIETLNNKIAAIIWSIGASKLCCFTTLNAIMNNVIDALATINVKIIVKEGTVK